MNLSNFYQKHVKNVPNKPAIICDDDKLTYYDIEKQSNNFANLLISLGVKKGDRVSFFMLNHLFLPIAYLGCFKIGAIAVPTSYFASVKEVEYEGNHCGTSLYFVTSEVYEKVKNANIKTLKHIIVIDKKIDDDSLFYPELPINYNPIHINNIDPEDFAMILYTSGSTGKPKGVTHSHRSLIASAINRIKTLNHTKDDVMFSTALLCHASASSITLMPMLYVGGTAVFINKFTPEHFIEMLKKYDITHFGSTPNFFKDLTEIEEFSRLDFSKMKYLFSGGEAIPVELQKTIFDLTNKNLSIGMGMTECGGYLATPPSIKFKLGSLGKPVHNVKIKLTDENYNEVKENQIGEILLKTDMIMSCYFNDEENTRKSFVDGWFKTGDLALKDNEGYYFFKGRRKNMIVKYSSNVSPLEIENELLKHENIKNVIVVGAEIKGETNIVAVIETDNKAQIEKNELVAFLKNKIADRKIPDHFVFVPELSTDTSIGKVNMKKVNNIVNDFIKNIN